MSGDVTVRDIANAAGVSVGTVSRALKNQRGLSDETRRHVRQVAADLGYDLSRLRSGKAPRLVFLIHRHHSNFAVNPFFAEVMHGVEEGCRQFGVAPTLLSARQGDAVGKLLKLHEPDALLVAGYFEDEVLAQLTDLGLPLVLVDGWIPGCAAVNPDNTGGGYQATRHLLDLGRQRIAYIAGSLAHFSIRERSRGYRRALFEAGVLADPDLEALAPPGMDDAEGAAAAMRTLLRRRLRPDAVFAYNDSAALAAMRVCLDAGLRIPEDIAFVGFDDIPAARYGAIPLTTLRVDKQELGRTGVEMLVGGGAMPQEMVMGVELMVRESSG
ncbi:LacI family DNA-binding transcriptional regulator [Sphaerotilus montanus]|uniref:DNA-binding LacI/PurR family transcriptional regulator n=1 Tax=Sphaerotilus montanus TaxID=522889 RepID=A0A7Y9UJH9_9BURK|nr:LacI family DNA-binding transcriptional regulator [Sphaerotilus montanus]NYG32775.1 DNA-binding LacI/PurR family transcriptional regulator [Sphaerotilus montanus]NZD56835.1 LacI family DNA-binding transcriptional regulator [Sphaerotilus montanus]